jgi:hypothetical protein
MTMMRYAFSRTTLAAAITITLLSGCASMGQDQPSGNRVTTERPAAVSVDGGVDWAWDISGDNAIRPAQVFSLNGKTYLQMLGHQLIPAVVVHGQPVPFVISPPYLVIEGEPDRMDLVTNGYRALVVHRGPVSMPTQPAIAPSRVERVASTSDTDLTPPPPSSPMTIAGYETAQTGPSVRDVPHAPVTTPNVGRVVNAAIVDAKTAAARVWRISPDQRLLSRALIDWSHEAGINLVWNTKVDVPITGYKDYSDSSFVVAMSQVLADASGHGYRFYFTMPNPKTITVVALSAS